MTRQQTIKKIESLYPADSSNDELADTGKQILQNVNSGCSYDKWRDLPDIELATYCGLCMVCANRNEKYLFTWLNGLESNQAGGICGL